MSGSAKPTSGLRAPSKISKPPQTATKAPANVSSTAASVQQRGSRDSLSASEFGAKVPAPESSVGVPTGDTNSSENLIIGDYVMVNGRRGRVAHLGEVKFAKGDWAGVVLDEPQGKNDGSVNGFRYFQCEANHGVFVTMAKVQKLPPDQIPTPRVRSPNQAPTTVTAVSSSTAEPTQAVDPSLAVGDRILVGGSRAGVIRFVGTTHFAPGDWVGVELDAPAGKNDGTVQGHRYFECRPLYGLFAPPQKIQKIPPGTMGNIVATPMAIPLTAVPPSTSKLASPPGMVTGATVTGHIPRPVQRVASNESLSSIGSSASHHVRNVTSGAGGEATTGTLPRRQSNASQQAVATPIQTPQANNVQQQTLMRVLQEKEEHVNQLLREIEQCRSELARAILRADDLEGGFQQFRFQHDDYVMQTNARLESLMAEVQKIEQERSKMTAAFEDERRRVEDLQFQLEEKELAVVEASTGGETALADTTSKLASAEAKLAELMKSEACRAQTSAKELETLQGQIADLEAAKRQSIADKDSLSLDLESLRAQLNSALSTSQEAVSNKELVLQEQIRQFSAEAAASKQALRTAQSESLKLEADLTESKRKYTKTMEELEALKQSVQADLTARDDEISKLKNQLTGLQENFAARSKEAEAAAAKAKAVLAEKTAALQGEVDAMRQSNLTLQGQISTMESQKMELQTKCDQAVRQQLVSDSDMKKLRSELDIAKAEVAKQRAAPPVSTNGADESTQLKAQLQAANQLVEFLNSVVADQQGRLDGLQNQLSTIHSGIGSNSPDNGSGSDGRSVPTRPLRLYCDICEIFDAHDTEDCSRQEGGLNGSGGTPFVTPSPGEAGVRRGSTASNKQLESPTTPSGTSRSKRPAPPPPRPYCTICEVFGHAAETCCADQTF